LPEREEHPRDLQIFNHPKPAICWPLREHPSWHTPKPYSNYSAQEGQCSAAPNGKSNSTSSGQCGNRAFGREVLFENGRRKMALKQAVERLEKIADAEATQNTLVATEGATSK